MRKRYLPEITLYLSAKFSIQLNQPLLAKSRSFQDLTLAAILTSLSFPGSPIC